MIHEHYGKNTVGTDYVVGDIHGEFTLLQHKLNNIGFNSNIDRLFCVGDLVDRGPESSEFIDWLQRPWFHSVRGNHEQLLIEHFTHQGGGIGLHVINGGGWFVEEYLLKQEVREKMYKACLHLPYTIDIETDKGLVGIIHADTGWQTNWNTFKENIKNRDQKARETCLWSRSRIKARDTSIIKGLHLLYVGHTVLDKVVQLGNVVYIDTGAVFSGNLTILKIGDVG